MEPKLCVPFYRFFQMIYIELTLNLRNAHSLWGFLSFVKKR